MNYFSGGFGWVLGGFVWVRLGSAEFGWFWLGSKTNRVGSVMGSSRQVVPQGPGGFRWFLLLVSKHEYDCLKMLKC